MSARTPASIRRALAAAAAPSEHVEQALVIQWAALHEARWPELALLLAIPNGGHRHPLTAAKLKAEGVRAGVPDLLLPVARGPWVSLWLELKRVGTGRTSPAQRAWHDALRRHGHAVHVCYGAEDAQAVLTQYLALPARAIPAPPGDDGR